MSSGEYLEGLVILAAVLGGTVAGAVLMQRRRLAGTSGSLLIVVLGLLATLGLLAVHVLPLALGVLSRGTVLAATALWLVACAVVPRAAPAAPAPEEAPAGPERDRRAGLVLAGAAVFAVVAYALAVLRDGLFRPSNQIDVMAFHLPGVARWMETGSLWQIDSLLPDVSPGHYPNNGDVVLLASVLPFRHDFLAHLSMVPFYALTGVALYALARELRVSRPAAALASCAVLAMPVIAIPALATSLVDILMLFGFVAGMLFLVRHHRTGRTADLVLAGLALGVAMGTKWYGLSTVGVVLVVWAGAALIARRPVTTVARQGAALGGLALLSGGIWFLRNLVESGNPVFPVKVQVLGVTLFDAPPDVFREEYGWTLLDYADEPSLWTSSILPQLARTWAAPSLLLLAGMAVAIVLVLLRRRAGDGPPRTGLIVAGGVTTALLLAVYAVLPYTAGGPEGVPLLVASDARYGSPALLVAAIAAAWAADRVRGGVVALGVLTLLTMVHALDRGSSGKGGAPDLTARAAVAAIVATALLGAAIWAAPRVWARLQGPRRTSVLAVGAVVVLAVAAAGGYETQQRFTENRYRGADPALDALERQGPSGQRVGLAGAWTEAGPSPVLPSFGPRYGNQVEFIGRWVEETIRRYERAPEFIDAVRRGDYDFIVVGRGDDPTGRPEERWLQDAGYALVTRSRRLSLFRRT